MSLTWSWSSLTPPGVGRRSLSRDRLQQAPWTLCNENRGTKSQQTVERIKAHTHTHTPCFPCGIASPCVSTTGEFSDWGNWLTCAVISDAMCPRLFPYCSVVRDPVFEGPDHLFNPWHVFLLEIPFLFFLTSHSPLSISTSSSSLWAEISGIFLGI